LQALNGIGANEEFGTFEPMRSHKGAKIGISWRARWLESTRFALILFVGLFVCWLVGSDP